MNAHLFMLTGSVLPCQEKWRHRGR